MNNSIKDILSYTIEKLNVSHINTKAFAGILYLLDWEYFYDHGYKLTHIEWRNSMDKNISILEKEIDKIDIKIIKKLKYNEIKPSGSEDHIMFKSISKTLDRVLEKELILNKSSFYFYETLTFDLFYNNSEESVVINFKKLIEMKKNKEY